MSEIRVLIVEDHALMREGITRAFDSAADVEVVGEATSAAQAVERTRRALPNVVILDNSLPDADGISIIQTLRRQPSAPSVLMLSFMSEGALIRQSLEAGASGYLVKCDVDGPGLREAVRAVMVGKTWMSRSAANSLASCVAGRTRETGTALTPRERQTWELLAHGLTNRDIANSLGISERTVKFHVSNVLNKLMVSSRTEAAALAYSSHFMPPS